MVRFLILALLVGLVLWLLFGRSRKRAAGDSAARRQQAPVSFAVRTRVHGHRFAMASAAVARTGQAVRLAAIGGLAV